MLRAFGLGLIGVLLASTAAEAATFSFEEPNVGRGYTYNPDGVTGVTFNAGSGVAGRYSPWFDAAAPDGNQAAFLQTSYNYIGSVSLSLDSLTAGQNYVASFFLARRPGYVVTPITVSFDGQNLGTFTPDTTDFTQFVTPAFQANGGTGTLVFTGSATTNGDNDTILDLVQVNGAAVGAVPEPATWAMMLGGFALVGASARRRRGVAVTA